MRTCLLTALAVGVLGLGLRLWLPVTPADESVREVVRFYRALARPAPPSNIQETTRP